MLNLLHLQPLVERLQPLNPVEIIVVELDLDLLAIKEAFGRRGHDFPETERGHCGRSMEQGTRGPIRLTVALAESEDVDDASAASLGEERASQLRYDFCPRRTGIQHGEIAFRRLTRGDETGTRAEAKEEENRRETLKCWFHSSCGIVNANSMDFN